MNDKITAEEAGNEEEIQADGKLPVPEYSGEFMAPYTFPFENVQKIANGVMQIYSKEDDYVYLAVNKSLAKYVLSPEAVELGKERDEDYPWGHPDDYLYYDSTTAAVPLFELSRTDESVQEFIISEESLRVTLCGHFSAYVTAYNSEHADNPIKNADATPYLFLQKQLDLAADSTRSEVNAFQESRAHESVFEHGLTVEVLEPER